MTLYGLRLLVALLTFAVGTAAAWLFNSASRTSHVTEVTVLKNGEVRSVTLTTVTPQTRECSLSRKPVEGGILNKKTISMPAPVYPPAAKPLGITDTIVVRVMVDEAGKVLTAEATGGHTLLREAAENAAREARFAPTRLSGEPVKVSGFLTYNFVLN